MRGEIIYFDAERGTGFVSGIDGNRYVFDASDIATHGRIVKGVKIAFEADGDRARDIVPEFQASQQKQQIIAAGVEALTPQPDRSAPTGMLGYFRYCMTTGFARFRGRARRREYWSFALFALIGFAIVGGAGFAAGIALGYNEGDKPTFTVVALILFWLCMVVPWLAVFVRRLHDIGLSGWFILLGFVPMVGSFIILVFTLVGSQKHENKWGPVPTGAQS